MKRESGRFSQQAINRIAELAIASQLKQDVEISVNIVSTLNQLAKGQIDAIVILIRRLVLSENLKTEEFQLEIGAVTVKPLSAIKGKIKLLHPSQGNLKVVIHEDDLTAALNQRLQQDFPQRVQSVFPVRCGLAENALTVWVRSDRQTEAAESIVLNAVPDSPQGLRWQLSSPSDPEFFSAIGTSLDQLLNLKDFEQKGLFLSLQSVQIANGTLQLDADALIQEFPPDED